MKSFNYTELPKILINNGIIGRNYREQNLLTSIRDVVSAYCDKIELCSFIEPSKPEDEVFYTYIQETEMLFDKHENMRNKPFVYNGIESTLYLLRNKNQMTSFVLLSSRKLGTFKIMYVLITGRLRVNAYLAMQDEVP